MGANAQTSVPTFTAGEILTAANMNISASTGVPVFATTADRDAAFGGTGEKTLAEGQYCYIESNKATQYYNGSAWKTVLLPWTSFTPTWSSGFTAGNATQTWAYQITGDIVTVEGITTLGTTSSVTGLPVLTLPVNRSSSSVAMIGFGLLQDSGVATYQAMPISNSQTNCIFFATAASGNYAETGSTSATVPFTWGTGDEISATLTYKQA